MNGSQVEIGSHVAFAGQYGIDVAGTVMEIRRRDGETWMRIRGDESGDGITSAEVEYTEVVKDDAIVG